MNLPSVPAYVGNWLGSGSFNLSGSGVANFASMTLGNNDASGSASLSGSAVLNLSSMTVANIFNSSGSLSLSQYAQINVSSQVLIGGVTSSGTLTQSGGTNAIGGSLTLGIYGGSGSYFLNGGLLKSATGGGGEFLGSDSLYDAAINYPGIAGTGLFQQTGGTNNTSLVWVGSGSRYQFSGGAIQLNSSGGLQVMSGGTLDGGNGATTLHCRATRSSILRERSSMWAA